MSDPKYTYTGDGSTTDRLAPEYLRKEHIHVDVNGVSTAFTWVDAANVRISPAPTSGAAITVYRETPDALLVTFQDDVPTPSSSFNTAARQAIFIAHERSSVAEDALDQAETALAAASDALDQADTTLTAASAASTSAAASASAASTSAGTASSAASAASASASAASASAGTASSAASAASTSATAASTSATAASTSATAASNSATAAAASAAAAAADAATIAGDIGTATTAATNAAASATSATSSASAASTSATAAATSATAAAASAAAAAADAAAVAGDIGGAIAAATSTTPADAHDLAVSAGGSLFRTTWASVKSTLKTYFDALYAAASHDHTFTSVTSKPTTLSGYGITDAVGDADVATFGEFNSATAGKVIGTDSTWANLAVLTDAATISVDFNAGYDFGGASNAALALGGNRTLGAPTNVRNGKKGILWFTASGSTRTLTLNAAWVLATGVEVGPYSITTSQTLGVAYVSRGSNVIVTGILRIG